LNYGIILILNVIFLIDVSSPQMHLKREDDDTELQCALRVVYSTLQKKIFASPNDVIGVLLFGTEKNHQIKDFENLSLILPLDVAEGKYINQIEEYAFDLKNLDVILFRLNKTMHGGEVK